MDCMILNTFLICVFQKLTMQQPQFFCTDAITWDFDSNLFYSICRKIDSTLSPGPVSNAKRASGACSWTRLTRRSNNRNCSGVVRTPAPIDTTSYVVWLNASVTVLAMSSCGASESKRSMVGSTPRRSSSLFCSWSMDISFSLVKPPLKTGGGLAPPPRPNSNTFLLLAVAAVLVAAVVENPRMPPPAAAAAIRNMVIDDGVVWCRLVMTRVHV
mmetsp:Transcript_61858/g.151237  ORF Transcript_61858/g.151237 Transcript_61858/m.151237 type:complete len:214 (-) Transcript_61858:149-790(-)